MKNSEIRKIFDLTTSKYFYVGVKNRRKTAGYSQSYYAAEYCNESSVNLKSNLEQKIIDIDQDNVDTGQENKISFDISNNKVLANIALDGTLKEIVFFRRSYFADSLPGV
ncbi:MAG: hypothetical protein ACYDIA_00290 [Candidatus Humimicrobiaceae bacterium]